ncbi:MAG: AraC family transcriptional regulator [Planctomycetes bacterium]|nr:AraC family transcriptional regulator [Planctomycetota bacterium]
MLRRDARPTEPNPGEKSFGAFARTPLVTLGLYRCAHTNALRGAEELQPAHTINFPRRGVYVKHLEGREVLVDPSSIVFFNRGECWCSSHPHGVGDAGYYLSVRHDALATLAAELDPRAAERPERPFVSSHAPVTAELELAALALVRDAATRERLELEERVLGLVAACSRHAARVAARTQIAAGPPRLSRAHRELADAARALLVRRACDPLGLDDFARELRVSPFHLARVFRARFGTTLHAELVHRRLALALDELAYAPRDAGLTDLAARVGFSSHSHFTAAFRRRYGVTPSAWRARA